MKPGILCALLLVNLLALESARAATVYISDELTVPLRSGPSGQHRILHRGLPSGTTLEVLTVNESAGFTQIKTQRGTEGWIRSQYLVSEPIAKARLVAAQRKIRELNQRLIKAGEEVAQLQKRNQNAAAANTASSSELAKIQASYAELKRISDNAVTAHEENQKLAEVNARLHNELDDVAAERDVLEQNASNEGIMLGAGFIILGLIAGVLIKARPQRSAWN